MVIFARLLLLRLIIPILLSGWPPRMDLYGRRAKVEQSLNRRNQHTGIFLREIYRAIAKVAGDGESISALSACAIYDAE